MTLGTRAAAETAHWMGLVPLLAVSWRTWRDTESPDVAYWWLAVAFAVSWVADSVAHWLNPWTITFSYVVSQSTIAAAVFLARRDAFRLLGALCVMAVVALVVQRATGRRDMLLHFAAWSSVALIAAGEARGAMRNALVCYFGLGAVAYVVYAAWPGWSTWIPYQATRAVGIAWFCWAASGRTVLRVARRPA